jgi:hypothetical protein
MSLEQNAEVGSRELATVAVRQFTSHTEEAQFTSHTVRKKGR